MSDERSPLERERDWQRDQEIARRQAENRREREDLKARGLIDTDPDDPPAEQ